MKRKTICVCIVFVMMIFMLCGYSHEDNMGGDTFPVKASEAVLTIEKVKDASMEEKGKELSSGENETALSERERRNFYGGENIPILEEYGTIETTHKPVLAENGDEIFYYEIEEFYFNDTYPASWNETLREFYKTIYEEYDRDYAAYRQDYESYEAYFLDEYGYEPEDGRKEYWCDHLIVNWMTCFDEQYVCLLMNDMVYYIGGGGKPLSHHIGVIIDVKTGKRVTPLELMDCSEEELLLLINEQFSKYGYSAYDSYADFMNEYTCYVETDKIIFKYSFNGPFFEAEFPRTKE